MKNFICLNACPTEAKRRRAMKAQLLFLAALLIAACPVFIGGTAHAQTYQWALNAGGIIDALGSDITSDDSGNVYVVGKFQDIVDFDPSGNTANLTSNGVSDVFVAKYDAACVPVAATASGDTTVCMGDSVVLTASGGAATCGVPATA